MIIKAIQKEVVRTIKFQWIGVTVHKGKKIKRKKTVQTDLLQYA